jgi:hypothetical protein
MIPGSLNCDKQCICNENSHWCVLSRTWFHKWFQGAPIVTIRADVHIHFFIPSKPQTCCLYKYNVMRYAHSHVFFNIFSFKIKKKNINKIFTIKQNKKKTRKDPYHHPWVSRRHPPRFRYCLATHSLAK